MSQIGVHRIYIHITYHVLHFDGVGGFKFFSLEKPVVTPPPYLVYTHLVMTGYSTQSNLMKPKATLMSRNGPFQDCGTNNGYRH